MKYTIALVAACAAAITLAPLLRSQSNVRQPEPVGAAQPPGRLWVRIQDEHGRPAAARVYLTDTEGRAHIPPGSIARQMSRTGEYYFHANSEFRLEMPPGRATVEVVKGFEYLPAKSQVTIVSQRTAVATVKLRRLADMPADGWHSGDVHMHPNHVPGGLYMTMEDCLLLAQGEDIHVANLLSGSVGTMAHVFDCP